MVNSSHIPVIHARNWKKKTSVSLLSWRRFVSESKPGDPVRQSIFSELTIKVLWYVTWNLHILQHFLLQCVASKNIVVYVIKTCLYMYRGVGWGEWETNHLFKENTLFHSPRYWWALSQGNKSIAVEICFREGNPKLISVFFLTQWFCSVVAISFIFKKQPQFDAGKWLIVSSSPSVILLLPLTRNMFCIR